MATFEISGKLMVGVTYRVEAEDEDAALDVAVEVGANIGDNSGQHLHISGAVARSVAWHTTDCYPEPDDVVPVDADGNAVYGGT